MNRQLFATLSAVSLLAFGALLLLDLAWLLAPKAMIRPDSILPGTTGDWLAWTEVLPALWIIDRISGGTAYRRLRRCLCPNCGYDLRATLGRSPECGTISPLTTDGNIHQPFNRVNPSSLHRSLPTPCRTKKSPSGSYFCFTAASLG